MSPRFTPQPPTFICRECCRETRVADAMDAELADHCNRCSEEVLMAERYSY